MQKNKNFREGSEEQYGPRLVGEILNDFFKNSNEPLAVAYRKHKAKNSNWHTNTELGCDLKTILHSGQRMQPGKVYNGMLQCDSENIVDEFLCRDPHFTFVEMPPKPPVKHNPKVFDGKRISITRRDDGTYRPNFKPMHIGGRLTLSRYVYEVYMELCEGLSGLIEEV